MKARLVFLGRLEDIAGRPSQDIVADAALDWNDVLAWLGNRCSADLVDLVQGDRVRVALNGALIADKGALMLTDGDELAFLPPVSGG